MKHLAAHQSISLEAWLEHGDIETIEIEILDARGERLTGSGPLTLRHNRASWTWQPNVDGGAATLPDTLDTLVVSPRVKVRAKGVDHHEPLEPITVFRDRVELELVTAQGDKVADAHVQLHASADADRVQKLGPIATGDDGVAAFEGLRRWAELELRVRSPWRLVNPDDPWVAGKQVGRTRQVLVEPKTYEATILGIRVDPDDEFAPLVELGGQRRQYVNCTRFDPAIDVPAPDEDPSHFGHRIELRVGPVGDPAAVIGERIYVKLIHLESGGLDDAEPKPGLSGADERGVLAALLDEHGAIVTVELGCVGGDRFELQVCSADTFGAATEAQVEFVNWRRLYYELHAPRALAAALEPATLAPEAGPGPHHDVPTEVLDRLAAVLDPIHVEFTLARTSLYPDPTARLVDAAFFGRSDGRLLHLGHPHARGGRATRVKRPRTLAVELFDLWFDARVITTRQQLELDSATTELGPSEAGRVLVPDARALVGVAIPPAVWQALGGSGAGQAAVEILASDRLRVSLPADAEGPVRVTLSVIELTSTAECLAREAVVCLGPRADIVGHQLCHLLGHALGLAQHCDTDGCVMSAAVPSPDAPAPHGFCDACASALKTLP